VGHTCMVLESYASSTTPLSSSRRVLVCGLAVRVDEIAKNLNERHGSGGMEGGTVQMKESDRPGVNF
jgi:hypothetical protein